MSSSNFLFSLSLSFQERIKNNKSRNVIWLGLSGFFGFHELEDRHQIIELKVGGTGRLFGEGATIMLEIGDLWDLRSYWG